MQAVGNEPRENAVTLTRQYTEQNLENNWKGHKVSRWTAKQKLLVGAGLITFTAVAATLAMNAYTYYQNEKIKEIPCHINEEIDGVLRDINYYKKAAEKGKAADQYCLAEILRAKETEESLKEARKWYKKAINQGLTFARETLCRPEMFEHKFTLGDVYSEFRSICCDKDASFHNNNSCPWYKHRS
jgi:hypothetical protein